MASLASESVSVMMARESWKVMRPLTTSDWFRLMGKIWSHPPCRTREGEEVDEEDVGDDEGGEDGDPDGVEGAGVEADDAGDEGRLDGEAVLGVALEELAHELAQLRVAPADAQEPVQVGEEPTLKSASTHTPLTLSPTDVV